MTTTQVPTEAFDTLLLTALSAAVELDGDDEHGGPQRELANSLVDAVAAAVGVPAEDSGWVDEVWCDLLIDGIIGDEPIKEFLEELRIRRAADLFVCPTCHNPIRNEAGFPLAPNGD